jgi:L-threonine kinase
VQRIGRGRARGTFGELLQGVLPDQQRHFLVTLPIATLSTATFNPDASQAGMQVWPTHKFKSHHLATQLLAHFGLPPGGQLRLDSQLPEGKGLASSSADLVATARAIQSCYQLELTTPLLEGFLRRIEPTDGVMYDGITAFYHREVRLLDRLGWLPPLTVVALDEGGQVDTLAFNDRPTEITAAETQEYASLLGEIRRAIARADLQAIGRVATRSALLNQRRHLKRSLDAMLELCESIGGLGVVVAHSGTCVGILLQTEGQRFREQFVRARDGLRRLTDRVLVYQAVSS